MHYFSSRVALLCVISSEIRKWVEETWTPTKYEVTFKTKALYETSKTELKQNWVAHGKQLYKNNFGINK